MIKTEIAEQYCQKYPHLPNLTIARIAYAENPKVWMGLESARSSIRYVRGNHGETKKKQRKNKTELFKINDMPYNPLEKLPEPLTTLENWQAIKIDYKKALILPDLHVPYYCRKALTLALNWGLERECDTIILNGDFVDFFSISRWEKDPRKRDFPLEIENCIQVLEVIREMFPNAKIIFKVANHEERFIRYMWLKAPELLGISEFELSNILHFNELDIQLVGEMRPIMLGGLYIIHGHEFRFSISNPVNPARGIYNRAKEHCLSSHLHQSSEHSETGISGEPIVCWSTGGLCELHPSYMPINKWNHGFAIVKNVGNDEFVVSNKKIVEGKVY